MPGHRSNATRILLLTALVAAALTACGGFASTTSTSPATSGSTATSVSSATGSATSRGSSPATSALRGGKEAIPRLAGDTLSVAELYLRQLGLRAGQTLHKPNTKYQSGLVITTSPYAGDVVPYGSAVDLLVSVGSPGCQQPECPQNGIYVTMPDVLGQTVDQVTTTLALDGITLGSYAVEASSAARGTVICTDPAPPLCPSRSGSHQVILTRLPRRSARNPAGRRRRHRPGRRRPHPAGRRRPHPAARRPSRPHHRRSRRRPRRPRPATSG